MASHPPSQEPLQDRLKDQVTVSVKDALERTTSILSNLHRVQSYLDILRNMASLQGGQGIKKVLDQMRSIHNDTAALLQSVYLAEIGIQSLQGYEKGGGVNSSPVTSFMPILGGASGAAGDDDHRGRQERTERDMSDIVSSLGSANTSYNLNDTLPLAKKSKLSGAGASVAIVTCTSCGKRYANHSSSPLPLSMCRACMVQGTSPNGQPGLNNAPPLFSSDGSLDKSTMKKDLLMSSTPRNGGGGGGGGAPRGARGNLNRMSCKLCGASFLYKRCLHRHIRENHSEIDQGNLTQYIQVSDLMRSPLEDTQSVNISPSQDGCGSLGGMASQRSVPLLIAGSKGQPQQALLMPAGGAAIGQGEPHALRGQEDRDPSPSAEEEAMRRDMNAHELNGKYVCPTCSKPFDRPYRLQRHLQIHNPNRPKVTCQLCDKSFTRVDTLENHMKCLHSTERPFKCTFSDCNKSFPLQSALIHHLKVHMDGKPYKCNECDESFALLGEFRGHISLQHASTKDLRCGECYRVFSTTSELSDHIKLEHRLECEVCMRTFSRLAYLQSHIEVHKGDGLFNCRFCKAGFDSEYAYKKHIKSHPRLPKSHHSHPCSVCEQSFADAEALMEHYHGEDHQLKVRSMGLEDASILHTIEGGLSPEMRSLVDGVAGSMGAEEVDERLMQSIQGGGEMLRATTVTIDAVDAGGGGGGGGGGRFQVAENVNYQGEETRYQGEDSRGFQVNQGEIYQRAED